LVGGQLKVVPKEDDAFWEFVYMRMTGKDD
jgi:hypothetical protein